MSDELARLEYTQHTVAWPTLPLNDTSVYDDLNVDLAAAGGGTLGELNIRFYRFNLDNTGVRLECFGDGLPCLYDPRMQRFMEAWRTQPNPDALSPADIIRLLVAVGAAPSSYHQRVAPTAR
jgi:hypothetical protein